MFPIIRSVQIEDATKLLAIYAPIVEKTAVSFELVPPTLAEFEARIHKVLAHYPWVVCEQDGDIAGYAYASAHRPRGAYGWSVEPSVYVNPHYRRQGVGQALYHSLFALLRLQGYYNAYAGTTLPNAGSVALHQSVGFLPIGVFKAVGFKLGQWHDVAWWHLQLLNDTLSETETLAPPKRPSDLVDTEAWALAMQTGAKIIND